MKKMIVVFSIVSALGIISCHTNETNDPAKDSTNNTSSSDLINNPRNATDDPALQEGARLVAASDCSTCHKVNEKIVGPSFNDIANKYDNNEAMADELAYKIIKGGSGRWGTAVMTPHPSVTIPDAQNMCRYILSLRTK